MMSNEHRYHASTRSLKSTGDWKRCGNTIFEKDNIVLTFFLGETARIKKKHWVVKKVKTNFAHKGTNLVKKICAILAKTSCAGGATYL